jgi:hypothetical protein
MFNQPDFYTISQLDVKNKLILPSTELYRQISFKVNALYQDIHNSLINAHSVVATASKQVYEHPFETLTAWYEQTAYAGNTLYAQVQASVLPVYQDWQVKVSAGKQATGQYLQAFWENPEQVTLVTIEPLTRYVAAIGVQSERYWQLLLDNPEQLLASVLAPVTGYLASLTQETEAVLISGYYVLAELFSLLMKQPSVTLQALYHNTLSALLEAYFDIISSLLAIA